jgi:hypothetical protein
METSKVALFSTSLLHPSSTSFLSLSVSPFCKTKMREIKAEKFKNVGFFGYCYPEVVLSEFFSTSDTTLLLV